MRQKKTVITLCFLILMIVIMFIPFQASSIVLEIRYASEESNGKTVELFWTKEEKAFHAEDSFSDVIKSSRARIRLDETCSEAVWYRIDFVDQMQKFGISEVTFYVDGLNRWSLTGSELLDHVDSMMNISYRDIEGDIVWFEAENIDPIVVFSPEFAETVNADITERSFIKNIILVLLCCSVYFILLNYKKISVVLSKIGYIKQRKEVMTLCFLILMIVIMFIPFQASSIVLEIRYASEENNGNMVELFWTKEEKAFHVEDSFSDMIMSNKARIRLDETCSEAMWYRIDFVDQMQKFGISEVTLYVDGLNRWSLTGSELLNYVDSMMNISYRDIKEDTLWFEAKNIDPIIVFSPEFAEMVNSCITERSFVKNIIIVFFCCCVYIILLNYKKLSMALSESIVYKDFKKDTSRVFLWFSLIFVGITTILFWKYLTGEKLWIFMDIGSDSINQTYPDLVYLANEISNGNFNESWNGFSSLGNVRTLIYPTLYNWVAFWGKEHVAYLMGVSQFLKVLLAGFLFYFYLRTMNTSRGISSIFAIYYAYCAQIIIRGSWSSYPNEVVLFAFWLLCFERFYIKKDYKWLPIATGLFFLNFSGYYFVLYTGIFVTYGIFRYYSTHRLREITKERIKEHGLFFLSIIIGWFVSAVNSIPSLLSSLSSSRFVKGSGSGVFSKIFAGWDILQTAYFRTIGTDIIGVNDPFYVGTTNFLEDPAFYCGLLTIIMLPFSIGKLKKKEKVWYLLGLLIAFLYVSCVPVTKIASGFVSGSYKLASLWVIVLLLLTSVKGIEVLKEEGPCTIGIVSVVLLIIGFGVFWYIDGSNVLCLKVSAGIVVIFGILIWLTNRKISFVAFNIIVLLICSSEVYWMSNRIINDRRVVLGEQMTQKLYYNDYTVDAIDYLQKDDDEIFYRIDKDYRSIQLCDPLYQGYFGTLGYTGGVGDRKLTAEFYESLGFPIYGSSHYSLGFTQSTAINTLMNVKYMLAKKAVANYGYERLEDKGDVTIYENNYALPLGVVYDKYILRDDFELLSVAEKRNAMMKAMVIEKVEDIEGNKGINKINSLECRNVLENIDNLWKFKKNYSKERESDIFTVRFDALEKNEVAIIKININNKDNKLYTGGSMTAVENKIEYGNEYKIFEYYSSFCKGSDEYLYEFNIEGTNWVTFKISDDMKINTLDLYVLPQSVYYKEYLTEISELTKGSMETLEYSENIISGVRDSEEGGLMFFSIPYDENWHLYVDGEEVPIIQANIGFMGAYLTAGKHDIRLEYKGLTRYGYISACGFILCVFYFVCCMIDEKRRQHR